MKKPISFSNLMRARLKAFAADTRGTVTIEAVIMLPLLIWAYCALFVFFDAYRQSSINTKAAYTIGDMISRETLPINDDFLDGTYQMLNFLTRSSSARRMRVTVIRYDDDTKTYDVQWSHTRGSVSPLDTDSMDWAEVLPGMTDEERLIFVETWTDYSAPFRVGLDNKTIGADVFVRPRFTPQVLFDNG